MTQAIPIMAMNVIAANLAEMQETPGMKALAAGIASNTNAIQHVRE